MYIFYHPGTPFSITSKKKAQAQPEPGLLSASFNFELESNLMDHSYILARQPSILIHIHKKEAALPHHQTASLF